MKGEMKMENNVVEFPTQETKPKTVTQPEKGKGVTTINELRKKVKEIDIYSITPDPDVDTGDRYQWSIFTKNPETGKFTLNYDLFTGYFNKKTDQMEYRLTLKKERDSYYGNDYPKGMNSRDNDRILFTGQTTNYRGGNTTHTRFSECVVYTDSLRGTIVGVQYSLDEGRNKFFKNFLRSTLDPSIPNNWKKVHQTKTFEFVVATTTYETVTGQGRNEEEGQKNIMENDPTLKSLGGLDYQGKRELLSEHASQRIDFRTRDEILAERNAKDA
jgi:hypothetical protein